MDDAKRTTATEPCGPRPDAATSPTGPRPDAATEPSGPETPTGPRKPEDDRRGPRGPEEDRRGRALRALLEEALLDPAPGMALEELRVRGILGEGLPEVEALAGLVPPEGTHHKDLWEHTLQVVAACPARLELRWAALLHDIGKVPTRRVDPAGEVTFHRHEEVGAEAVERDVAARLGFGAEEARRVSRLVRHHHRAGAYHEGWTEAAVGRLGRDLGDQVEDLLALGRADVTSRLPGRREAALARVEALDARLSAWREAAERPRLLPPGLGHLVMERFGLAPGPAVGRLCGVIAQALRSGALPGGATPEECLSHLEQLKGAAGLVVEGEAEGEP